MLALSIPTDSVVVVLVIVALINDGVVAAFRTFDETSLEVGTGSVGLLPVHNSREIGARGVGVELLNASVFGDLTGTGNASLSASIMLTLLNATLRRGLVVVNAVVTLSDGGPTFGLLILIAAVTARGVVLKRSPFHGISSNAVLIARLSFSSFSASVTGVGSALGEPSPAAFNSKETRSAFLMSANRKSIAHCSMASTHAIKCIKWSVSRKSNLQSGATRKLSSSPIQWWLMIPRSSSIMQENTTGFLGRLEELVIHDRS